MFQLSNKKIIRTTISGDLTLRGISPGMIYYDEWVHEPTAEEKLRKFSDEEIAAEYARRSPLGKELE